MAWQSSSNSFWLNQSTADTNVTYFPTTVSYGPAPPLPSVAEADVELTDREWLDAQINDVCLLAA